MHHSRRVAPCSPALSRALALALLLPALVALLAPTPIAAATDYVTTCSGDPATMGSLLHVVINASAGDTIAFDLDCPPATPIIPIFPISIAENLTIDATGHNVAVDGAGTRRVFEIDSGMVTLNGLTIQHGLASNGGGIANGGTLTVMNSSLAGNTANNGDGGGISNTSTLTVMNSTFSGNTTPSIGGGGGIGNSGGTAIVTNCTFTNNSGGRGGGIGNDFGTVTVTNSTLSGNSSPNGGGIANGGTLTVTNTIIAGNSATGVGPDVASTIISGGHNLVGKTDGSDGWIASDQIGTAASPLSANLGLLASNGGPTQTLAVLNGSPAIGAGDPTVCAQTGAGKVNGLDQRGQPRLASTCDVGAFQLPDTLAFGLSGGAAGATLLLTVVLFDGYGALLAPYTGTLRFTSSDALATLPADYTFTGKGSGRDNGTHFFLVTLNTAGTQTVTLTDTLASTLTFTNTTVITPTISMVSPASGGTAGGTPVTITGHGFGTVPANVSVTIGGTPASVTSVTNTQLTIATPAHAAGPADIVVLVNGESIARVRGYTYITPSGLPNGQPSGGTSGIPATLPVPRPPGQAQSGSPSPLPVARP
jgi:hypothetical protein